jgi:hypothetical protein
VIDDAFDALHERTRAWLRLEQTRNERIVNTRVLAPIDHRSNTVCTAYRPESRPTWPLQVVWLPRARARCYGAVDRGVGDALGVAGPRQRVPLFVHPQLPASHRRLVAEFGSETLDGVRATPTASFRSVLSWSLNHGASDPVILKLSIGAVIGRHRRALREGQVARAVVVNSLFDSIPDAHRQELGLDWFAEPAGLAETTSRTGWILRHLPPRVGGSGRRSLVPAFALISRHDDEVPLLVRLMPPGPRAAETFVIDEILRPYVRALAYLLFEEGLQYEGHSQNVLLEVDARGRLTRRLALRDLSDTTVNIAYRVARRLPLPRLSARPARLPFALSSNAADFVSNWNRPQIQRGYDTVERYGLWGFVWPLNTSVARFVRGYDAATVEHAYLALWQEAARFYTNVTPLPRRHPKGLATDEATAYYLQHVDWSSLGAVSASLPEAAVPLMIGGRAPRRSGRVYHRIESAWGDIFVFAGKPVFFRPAY